jgi:hypothetical protein
MKLAVAIGVCASVALAATFRAPVHLATRDEEASKDRTDLREKPVRNQAPILDHSNSHFGLYLTQKPTRK